MNRYTNDFRFKSISFFLLGLFVSFQTFAWKEPRTSKGPNSGNQIAAGCTPATTKTDLSINNVKATIGTGGDMWFDGTIGGAYEVPKGSGKKCMYSGGLWMGGKDVSGQLKVAGIVYRSYGDDFWPGPLSTENFDIDAPTCAAYDQHFYSTRSEVKEFAGWYACSNDPDCDVDLNFPNYKIPDIILEWPAHGRDYDPYNEDQYLAPFYDNNGDGVYSPSSGDYPRYDLSSGGECGDRRTDIYGDGNLWWVFNDKGNVHTATGSNSIGMEIRAQAFGFATNDEVNSMTFYNYELINRSSFTLTETYFGVFTDCDIGGYEDDYVGCDVQRGLGYCYNGDAYDAPQNGAAGYLDQPPAIGIDFFEGPYQDNDGIDNNYGIGENEALNGIGYGDGVPDNERFGMRRFVYFSRQGASCCTDPTSGTEYYNYLRGIWKNGSPMTHGGTGINGTLETNFMFPGNSDPLNWGTNGVDPGYPEPQGWTEEAEDNTAGDRRFVQSAGPFTLLPGAVNDITVGVVWAQATSGGQLASVDLLLKADQKTQNLFDNCFQVLDGPDAPVLQTQELDKEIILYITNPTISNNYQENYSGRDPSIVIPDSVLSLTETGDSTYQVLSAEEKSKYGSYKFQGYKVYQVIDNTIGPASLNDVDKARLIYQCDIRDEVTTITNFDYDPEIEATVAQVMVDGNNEGIKHSLRILEDQFATGDRKLINYKSYCFIAIAYAHNNYKNYDPNNPSDDAQTKPYLESRKSPTGSIRAKCAIPRNTKVELGGNTLQASFGDGVELTRIEGVGNGGTNLSLVQSSIDEIMAGEPWKTKQPKYKAHYGPIDIKIIDPLNVIADNFVIQLQDTTPNNDLSDAYWAIWRESDPEDSKLFSVKNINTAYEQLIPDWGISVLIEQPEAAGTNIDGTYGLIDATLSFADESKPWLTGVSDVDADSLLDWIAIGASSADWLAYESYTPYENILDGTWAPARLCSDELWGPIPGDINKLTSSNVVVDRFLGDLSLLESVDIVLTDDQSKWTRCPVIEMGPNPEDNKGVQGIEPYISVGGTEISGAIKGRLRQSASVDKDGNPSDWPASTTASSNDNDPNYIAPYGMGWFPGYAINVETGERLNMAFGENSMNILEAENGSDMLWNPTDRIVDDGPFQGIRLAGQHFIFVFRNNTIRQGETNGDFDNQEDRMPGYDAGQFSFDHLSASAPTSGSATPNSNLYDVPANLVYGACTWVGFPLLEQGYNLLETEATIQLRVQSPFKTYGTEEGLDSGESLTIGDSYWVNAGPVVHQDDTLAFGESFVAETNSIIPLGTATENLVIPVINDGLPQYNFTTIGLEAVTNNDSIATSELDGIAAVPNPYYAYSAYETDRLDTRIRIINLPEVCTVSIYSVNGVLIKQFSKDDDTQTWLDWDLKNHAYVPIASGVYLIHVEAPGLGERVIKWFGALRPTDLDSF